MDKMKKFDLLLFGIVIFLTLFGLLIIYDASSVIGFSTFGDKYHFIKEQLLWMGIGFLALLIFSLFDYHKLIHLALPLLIFALFLLILVFVPGVGYGAKGANRWIDLRIFGVQPAEFVKLVLAVYLAAWFSNKDRGKFLSFTLLIGAVLLLVMLEPDMGTASIILFEAMVVYFLSGGSMKNFGIAAPVIAIIGFIIIKLEPYRAARLTSFLTIGQASDLSEALQGPNLWHIKQALIALGSGGLFGLGIGNSLQKYAYLPENVTDSIFPIIAEEFGFSGSVILILVFLALVWRGFYIATKAKDKFGKLLAAGIITFIGIQIVINLGAMTALFPLTGVPLPFISYGGSALVIDMASIGILLNISRQAKK